MSTSLTKQSWIFFTTIFLKKLFFVMIKINCGSTIKLEKILTKKNETLKQYIANEKTQKDYKWLQLIAIS